MASSTGRFPISFFCCVTVKTIYKTLLFSQAGASHVTHAGSHLDGKVGNCWAFDVSGCFVETQNFFIMFAIFFQPEKTQDELLFWRDRRRTVLQRRLLRRWWGLVPSFYQKWRIYRCSVMQCSRLFADRYRVFVVPRSLTDTEEI